MAINFPSGPSVNDTHTDGVTTWRWNGATWDVIGSTQTLGITDAQVRTRSFLRC